MDGKTLRGTFSDDGAAGVTLVAAYLHRPSTTTDDVTPGTREEAP